MLIRSLPRLRVDVPDLLYANVVRGAERDFLRRPAHDLTVQEHVQFTEDVQDSVLLRCYQQCDLFALPNREIDGDIESFGLVLVEAQACGKPVIAGASGGTAESLLPGETGEAIPCETPDPLAAGLTRLLGAPARRQTMALAARRWAVEQFDWSTASERARQALFATGSAHSAS